MKTRTCKRNRNATAYPAGWARVGSTEWLGFEAWMLKTFGVPHMKSKIGQQLENAAWNGWMAALVWQRTGKVVNSMKPNAQVELPR